MIIQNPPPITPTSMMEYDRLLKQAGMFSRHPVSGFTAAAAVIGNSGTAYLGTNIEFKGGTYADSIHAEQFAAVSAWLNGEEGISHVIASAEPCGHCRQFLLEAGNPNLSIHFHPPEDKWRHHKLSDLLPFPFTLAKTTGNIYCPAIKRHLILSTGQKEQIVVENPLLNSALSAAQRSYTPVSAATWAGIALRCTVPGHKDNLIYSGSVLESSAFNPTIPPLQVALIDLVSHHPQQKEILIEEALLIEPEDPNFSYRDSSARLLTLLSPKTLFWVLTAYLEPA